MVYIALIGDLIDSKKLANRSEMQSRLHQTMQEMNETYKDCFASPLTVTTGDEFQALLYPNQVIFQMVDHIRLAMKPAVIRFGIGIGDIVTDINPQQSIGADGPAYWQARSAIDTVHDKNDYGATHIRVCLIDEQQAEEALLNALLAASEFIQSKWTSKQEDILTILLEQEQYKEYFEHQALAEKLGIEPSALTKRLKASGLKVYLRSRREAADLLYRVSTEKGTR